MSFAPNSPVRLGLSWREINRLANEAFQVRA